MFSFLQGYLFTSGLEEENKAAQIIIRAYRGHLIRKKFLKLKHSCIQVQRRIRRNSRHRCQRRWRRQVRESIYGDEFCYARDLRILLKYRSVLYSEIQDINRKIEQEFECSF